jgi:hypothetical protein
MRISFVDRHIMIFVEVIFRGLHPFKGFLSSLYGAFLWISIAVINFAACFGSYVLLAKNQGH